MRLGKFNLNFGISKRKRRKKGPEKSPPQLPAPNPYNAQEFSKNYEPEFRKQYLDNNGLVEDLARKYRSQSALDRDEGRKYADQLFERYGKEGLDPSHKLALQESAQRDINRQLQSQNRLLLGKQGNMGVRGGVNFAQQNELARTAQDARLRSENDIRNLDEQMKMRKLAARFGIEQGFAGQGIFARQSAEDLLEQYRQRLQQQQEAERFSKLFQI